MHHNHPLINCLGAVKILSPAIISRQRPFPNSKQPFCEIPFPFLGVSLNETSQRTNDDLCVEKGKSREIAHLERALKMMTIVDEGRVPRRRIFSKWFYDPYLDWTRFLCRIVHLRGMMMIILELRREGQKLRDGYNNASKVLNSTFRETRRPTATNLPDPRSRPETRLSNLTIK